ncbi:uncharacterized protein Triagg1_5252 [Trichoderma aggressivum f. europaeum]|uniref:Uncharacterized protein n=1 Tax=Trichoderma aggressivum f. europaeum TaxID=173218 RepID=A0AAE1IDC2_9HYPO|nr:hypothetical protein Triagg1_5252 [Trichoderma aggressivum f. europaeum]
MSVDHRHRHKPPQRNSNAVQAAVGMDMDPVVGRFDDGHVKVDKVRCHAKAALSTSLIPPLHAAAIMSGRWLPGGREAVAPEN